MPAILLLLTLLTILFGCKATQPKATDSSEPETEITTFKDPRDGKSYRTVKIGEQVWMAENLNYNAKESLCYGDGGTVVDGKHHINSTEVQKNCETYGRLYKWETAKTVCPKGWHLPKKEEFDKLASFAGDYISNSLDDNFNDELPPSSLGNKIRAKSGWGSNKYGDSMNGDDVYGFAALPGGLGVFDSSNDSTGYATAGEIGWLWSATEHKADSIYVLKILQGDEYLVWDGFPKTFRGSQKIFFSIRCVRD